MCKLVVSYTLLSNLLMCLSQMWCVMCVSAVVSPFVTNRSSYRCRDGCGFGGSILSCLSVSSSVVGDVVSGVSPLSQDMTLEESPRLGSNKRHGQAAIPCDNNGSMFDGSISQGSQMQALGPGLSQYNHSTRRNATGLEQERILHGQVLSRVWRVS